MTVVGALPAATVMSSKSSWRNVPTILLYSQKSESHFHAASDTVSHFKDAILKRKKTIPNTLQNMDLQTGSRG